MLHPLRPSFNDKLPDRHPAAASFSGPTAWAAMVRVFHNCNNEKWWQWEHHLLTSSGWLCCSFFPKPKPTKERAKMGEDAISGANIPATKIIKIELLLVSTLIHQVGGNCTNTRRANYNLTTVWFSTRYNLHRARGLIMRLWQFRWWWLWGRGEGLDLVQEYRLIISFSLNFGSRMILTSNQWSWGECQTLNVLSLLLGAHCESNSEGFHLSNIFTRHWSWKQ